MRSIFLSAVLVFFVLSVTAQDEKPQAKPWPVPDEFKNMPNPVQKNKASEKTGMTLYIKHCASCHGKAGLGDGVKSRTLKDFAGDFSGSYYQDQTDGEHFYKTKFGRGEMPKYEGKLSDEEIWHTVNYMRTFRK